MIKIVKNIPVRLRIVWVAGIAAALFFILTTPIINWVADIVTPPDELANISITTSTQSIKLRWNKSDDIDLRKITININDQIFELGKTSTDFEYDLDSDEIPESIVITTRDLFTTTTTKINIIEGTVIANQQAGGNITLGILFRTSVIVATLAYGMYAVVGFKTKSLKSKVIIFYPALSIIPYILITLSFLIAEQFQFNKFILSFMFSIVLYVISYFVILTTNILNTALEVKIPLEQAARASQFIFSLISSYLILILFFGANFNFFEKLVLIGPPVFYLTFSSILMLEHITPQQSIIRSLSITLTILYAIFVLSIWPVNYVYAILSIAVVFYILLSIALEIRSNLNRYVWVEYMVLVALITFLLVINSSWGINGTLL
ncbi:hypothetical protein KC669_00010 [Candidatus Dojkabacteria bacterium]|uniref:Uncharacterized protein n=1 Tax=Candidatus Dojkabacteria bacterium TaxID=2099670 RepID=A0A955LA63_9BACT|nr:hypothetical protein [Candidatus Dojkabacteria bacterium]